MVKVITPLGIEPVAATGGISQQARIIQIALSDQMDLLSQTLGEIETLPT